jgi:integrase
VGRPKTGSIEQRGPRSWRLRVYLGADPDTGRALYARHTVTGSKSEARAQLNRMVADAQVGMLTAAGSQTVDEYLDHWIADVAGARVRFNTLEQYRATLKRYVRPKLGRLRLTDLHPQHIQGVITELARSGLKPRTVQLAHATLRAALNDALRLNLVPRNAALSVRLPKMNRPRPASLSAAQVGQLLEHLAGDHYEPLVRFLVHTGLRPSEAAALQWGDVDVTAKTLQVRRTMRRFKGEWRVSEPKSERSRRTLSLSAGALAAIAAQQRDQAWVFTTPEGYPVDMRKVADGHLKPALRRAGLDDAFKLYNLRHTHATLLLESGADVKTVSDELGHSTIVLTLDTYVSGNQERKRAAVQRLDELLGPAVVAGHALGGVRN